MNIHHEQDILKRNAELEKELAAKNHELEIEAALERVRSRTNAMHRSENLHDVITEVNDQLRLLGFRFDATGFLTDYSDRGYNMWIANFPTPLYVPAIDHKIFNLLKEVVKRGDNFFTFILTTEEKNIHFKNIFENTIAKNSPDELKEYVRSAKGMATSCVVLKNINLSVSNFASVPYTDGENEILKRFAYVFEQSYTRFLDLQKAEEQTRESQIELGLERVRARAMAMQKSDELSELVDTVFKELTKLDFALTWCIINIIDEPSLSNTVWAANPDITKAPESYHMLFEDYPFHHAMMKGWKERNTKSVYTLEGDEKRIYDDYLFNETEFKRTPEAAQAASRAMEKYVVSFSFSNFGGLQTVGDTPLSDANLDILSRFGKVFDLTYTRFNDLKQAEAQAREAKIEAALEKVRSSAMAMHNSNDISSTTTIIFVELKKLGIQSIRCGIGLLSKNSPAAQVYAATTSPDSELATLRRSINMTDHPALQQQYESWLKRENYIQELKQDELRSYYQLPFFYSSANYIPPENFEQSELGYYIPFSEGVFYAWTKKIYSDDEINILNRFKAIVDLTFRRYLDLQKAEAQARESQIQLALERVRARTMAMQKSNELAETASLLFTQIADLGTNSWSSGFIIFQPDELSINSWMSKPDGSLGVPFNIPVREDPFFIKIYEAYKRGEEFFVMESGGKELEETYRYMFGLPGAAKALGAIEDIGFQMPTFQITHCTFFHQGFLMFITYESCPEMWDIFKRFGKVFEQTYTRFLDLEKAEAQAKESQIQLALERVRARTMAMQHSDELKNAAALLFQQVKSLGAPAYSCGYNIWEKNEKEFTSWMSTQDGSIINGVPNIPLTEDANFIRYVESKQNGEQFFVLELRGERMQEHYEYLKTIPAFKAYFEYAISVGFDLPETQIHHLANFSNGNLLFITLEPCPEFHDVFKRFAAVFEQTYTRFLDLQKAETQARDSQIELALERVRARTMAMQKSDELREAVLVIYEQLQQLNFESKACNIIIIDKESGSAQYWVSGFSQEIFPESYMVPYLDHPYQDALLKPWKQGDKYVVYEYTGKMKQSFDEIFFTQTEFRNVPEDAKKVMIGLESVKLSTAFISYGALQALGAEPLSEENANILQRFAKVFEQTYTRFLDLQKAEAQAREAQIEAALEKVRSRSLAMHTANELGEVVTVIVEKLKDLGVVLDGNGVVLCTYFQHSKDVMHWIVSPDFSMAASYLLPYFDHPIFNDAWQSRESGDEYFSKSFSVEEKNSFFEYAFEHSDYKYFPEDFKQWIFQNDKHILSFAWQKNSAILIPSHTGVLPTESDKAILIRFAKVFEQSYVRFLDLQKAEAQAKESQIQLALERVRARTMAMQKSDELPQAANLLFQQIQSLGMPAWSAGYCIWDDDKKAITLSMSSEGVLQPTLRMPLTEDPSLKHFREAYENGESFFVEEVGGDALKEHYTYLRTLPGVKETLDDIERAGFPVPTFQIFHLAYFTQGFLLFITYEQVPESHDIFKRFAKVFEQTYTRFLDLQKAEASAREAQIEAALERVRSRSMAMYQSTEMNDVAIVLFQQLRQLGGNLLTCGIVLCEANSTVDNFRMAVVGGGIAENIYIPNNEEPVHKNMYEGWKTRKELYTEARGGEELKAHYDYMMTVPSMRPVLENLIASGFPLPTWQKWHAAYFSQGYLLIITLEPYAEEQTLKRFAKVFEQTYTRFLDLQKAEAQAKESQIQLALERVRARTMAMQKSDELPETSFLLFQQVKELGLTAVQNSIAIINEETGSVELSTTVQGHHLPHTLNVPINDPYVMAKAVAGWKAKLKSLTLEFEGQELKIYNEHRNSFLETKVNFPEDQWIVNIIFFSKGWLSFSSNKNISDETFDLLKRFAAVFEQTYIRFNDLKQAEEQARESQIQLALERVRARTMAMQKSDELMETAVVLFDQLKQLGENIERTIIGVVNEEEHVVDVWATRPDGSQMDRMQKFPIDEPIVMQKVYAAWRQQKKSIVIDLQGEELESYFQFLKSRAPGIKRKGIGERRVENFVFFSKGMLGVISADPNTAANVELYERFAAVFDQTYTRFLDLQKSEAQARESQIEAALERVRSRSMGMQKSEELKEVIQVVYEQFVHLNINVEHTGFVMDYKARDDYDIWIADQLGVPSHVTIPYFDCVYYNRFNEAKKNGEDFFVTNLDFEEKNRFYQKIIEYVHRLSEETKEFLFSIPGLAASTVLLENVCLYIENFSGIPFSDEENKTLMRFGKVFQQTYTRFLDLQKAEAQAREAKIEAALEKVRASTMAMQHSDHLSETAFVLFKQFKELGEAPERIFIATFDEEEQGIIDIWGTNQGGNQLNKLFKVSADEPTVISKIIAAWKEKKRSLIIDLSGEELKQYISFLRSTGIPVAEGIMEERRVQTIGCFSKGVIGVTTPEPQSAESVQLLERFAGVFDLTYTRFLDLQQAEAQAREAKIEAALERVRSRTMAMQHSDELKDAALLLFQQVQSFGVDQWACGYNIWEADGKTCTAWMSRQGRIQPPFKTHPAVDHCFQRFYDAKQRGESFYVDEIGGDEIKTHYKRLISLPEFESAPKEFFDEFIAPEFQIFHIAYFEQGYLMFITYKPVPQTWDIFKRFAKVFEQTYTRFLDLQKSEAQAREAIKQASIDRIRAEIASMRTTNDLERIQPLIWDELTTLGVPFTRCGVFILDEEHEQVDTFLSTPEGRSIASFTSNYSDVAVISEALPYWRKKEIYKAHWDEATFLAQAQTLLSQGNIKSTETYLTEHRPKDLYLHFLPFLQGILYVGNETPLNNDELQLVQNLADAFSIAYARYEDFNKLELAKEQIENTLTNLKQAQAQLVQSEKMASLGELTAGIAHEIQNPLNFVNNFSEVNTELIAEMKDEIEKGNIEGVKAIANDIADNEQKINHHGKRADAIVKGMLQHSRSSSGVKEPSDINVLADEYLRLAYHGLRAKDKSFNATMKTDYDETIGKINIVPQDVGRSVLNLITNAFYAVSEKKKQNADGYEPTVTVTTKRINGKVEIRVADNGNGIPQKVLDKIFQPFFTTKPTGQGTGLGLSLSYDIVKAYNGELKVKTNEGEGSEFIIFLPANN